MRGSRVRVEMPVEDTHLPSWLATTLQSSAGTMNVGNAKEPETGWEGKNSSHKREWLRGGVGLWGRVGIILLAHGTCHMHY